MAAVSRRFRANFGMHSEKSAFCALWRLRSEPPRKLSYFVKHFVGSYSIAGMLVMLLAAIAEKEIYIPSAAVIAGSGPEANTHFPVHTFSPGMNLLWNSVFGHEPSAGQDS